MWTVQYYASKSIITKRENEFWAILQLPILILKERVILKGLLKHNGLRSQSFNAQFDFSFSNHKTAFYRFTYWNSLVLNQTLKFHAVKIMTDISHLLDDTFIQICQAPWLKILIPVIIYKSFVFIIIISVIQLIQIQENCVLNTNQFWQCICVLWIEARPSNY